MADTDNTRPIAALPPGTRLDEFELRRVLGSGGFGIVYLAFDHALEREVAIKEYMPVTLVGRSHAGTQLSLLSQANADSFTMGLRSFVNEARLLARFDAPGLVKVHRYWEANNTAYMAMPFYAGSSLHAVRRHMDVVPEETWLRTILQPLLDALERLHREGIYHRDIAPDNVILQHDGQPVLLDFGAARRVISDRSVALTAILKPAYAPIEQYAEAGAVKQGAWTDLYALGATLHFLLLGRPPPPATARAVQDEMRPLASQPALLARCSAGFLQALDWMLQPRPADRPQSVAALRARLAPASAAPTAAAMAADNEDRTVLDLSRLPPTPPAPADRSDEATVLIPRKAAPPTPPPQANHEATVFMPRREDTPTILMPRREPRQEEVSLLLPLDDDKTIAMPRPAPHEPTMRMPPPGSARQPPQQPSARREMPLPPPAPAPSRRPVLLAGVLLALGAGAVATWLALKPAAPVGAVAPGAAASAASAP